MSIAASQPPGETAPLRILRKFSYLLGARWVRDVLHTVFLIYLARRSAETYGQFMLALGLGQILLLVAEFGLNLPLVTLLGRSDRDSGETLAQVSLLKGLLLLAGCLGGWVFIQGQSYARPLQQVMLVLGLGVGLEALGSTFFVACQVRGRQDLEGKVKSLGAAIGFGYGLLTLALGAPPLVVAFFKLIETLVNLTGGAALTLARVRLPRPSLTRLGPLARRGLIFALIEIAAITYNKANLFFLQRYGGDLGVAQYSAAWQTVDGISCVVSGVLLQSVLFPLFVQFWESDRERVTRLAQNTAAWLLAAALAAMFILAIESDRIIGLIYGPHYRDAVWLQKYLVPTVLFAFLHNLAAFVMMCLRRERLLLLFYTTGLVFNLLWCALVIPRAPLWGAGLAMVLTKGVVALLTVSYCQWHLGLVQSGPLRQLAGASLAGAAGYFLGTTFFTRELAEILALIPLLILAWRWWREMG